jgi:hypothetical protein
MYVNAPPEVEAVKNMLASSATWVALNGTIHYPSVSSGDSVSPDAPPTILVEPVKNNPTVLAPNVILPGGTLQLQLTLVDSSGADIEKKARAIGDELIALPTGLPIISVELGMCSEPNAGERAAQEYSVDNSLGDYNATRTIAIIVTYGLT